MKANIDSNPNYRKEIKIFLENAKFQLWRYLSNYLTFKQNGKLQFIYQLSITASQRNKTEV